MRELSGVAALSFREERFLIDRRKLADKAEYYNWCTVGSVENAALGNRDSDRQWLVETRKRTPPASLFQGLLLRFSKGGYGRGSLSRFVGAFDNQGKSGQHSLLKSLASLSRFVGAYARGYNKIQLSQKSQAPGKPRG